MTILKRYRECDSYWPGAIVRIGERYFEVHQSPGYSPPHYERQSHDLFEIYQGAAIECPPRKRCRIEEATFVAKIPIPVEPGSDHVRITRFLKMLPNHLAEAVL